MPRRRAGTWERLEGREIRRRQASSARSAARRGITRPDLGGRPRPDLPEGADLLPQIRHIVILMMENHSYDNYLGMLDDRGEGLPLGPGGTPDVVNYLPDGPGYPARHMSSTTQLKNNPSQNWRASHIQFADGRNDGFAAAVAAALPGADPAVPMGYWTEDDLPFYYGLARTFPLCDHWFSSCLGPTFPNRRFLISGTVPAHNYILDLPRWLRTLLSPVFGGGFARLKAIDDGPRDYARYGFRVPAVIVSPYARPDYVCGKTFDHTSVLKLIEEKWNLPPLTRRDAAAESPLDAVDLGAEPAFAEPPKLPEPTLSWGSWGRQPRRRRLRDLKWKSVRLAQRRTSQR